MVVKNTGLGYTVIRAGPLVEEPGGYKALIFDQVLIHSLPAIALPDTAIAFDHWLGDQI